MINTTDLNTISTEAKPRTSLARKKRPLPTHKEIVDEIKSNGFYSTCAHSEYEIGSLMEKYKTLTVFQHGPTVIVIPKKRVSDTLTKDQFIRVPATTMRAEEGQITIQIQDVSDFEYEGKLQMKADVCLGTIPNKTKTLTTKVAKNDGKTTEAAQIKELLGEVSSYLEKLCKEEEETSALFAYMP